jgi:hypothetical protein
MNSKSWKTALTHFSQRFNDLKKDILITKNYKSNPAKYEYAKYETFVAMDHLTIKLSQL